MHLDQIKELESKYLLGAYARYDVLIDRGSGACRNTTASMVATLRLIDTICRASAEGRRIECRIGPA